MMKKRKLAIEKIPAVIWGEPSKRLVIAAHGSMSHKEDEMIELLAEKAREKNYQVLSFDLPGHGERGGAGARCLFSACGADLKIIMAYARRYWTQISLFGCSMGAYLSLTVYEKEPLKQTLFLSPVTDMGRLTKELMARNHITEQMLELEGEMHPPGGQALYWEDFCYIKEHPVAHWECPTAVLYGAEDKICSYDSVAQFAQMFGACVEIVPKAEHYFHTLEQLKAVQLWLERSLIS